MTATPYHLPATPYHLPAALSDGSAILYWQNNAYNEAGFHLKRSADGGNTWTSIPDQAATAASFTDTGLFAHVPYLYSVTAFNSAGTSAAAQASVTTLAAIVPLAPKNITASATSPTQINVSWTSSGTNQTGFVVDIFETSGIAGTTDDVGVFVPAHALVFMNSVTVAANATSYTATVANSYSTPAIIQYVFEVRAVNAAGSSADSAASSAVLTPFDTSVTPPAAPTNFQYNPGPAPFVPFVNDPSDPGASGGRQISVSASPDPTAIGAPTADISQWLQAPNTTYTFKERYFNAGGFSDWSSSVSYSAGGFSVVNAPASFSASSSAPGRIDLSWSASQNGVTYVPLISTDGVFWQSPQLYLNADGHSGYITQGVLPGTSYTVRLAAEQGLGGFPFTFSTPFNVRLSSTQTVTTGGAQATVAITAPDSTAAEAGPDGNPDAGHFLVTRTSTDYSQPLTVNYTVDTGVANAATPGHEYTALSGSVTIPAGDESWPIDVTPKAINHVEGTTNVAVALASGSGYTASSGEATVSITNTDDGTIIFPSDTFTVGFTSGLPVTFRNHYGRYVADTLTPSGFDSTIISPQAANVTTSLDPASPVMLQVFGVNPGTSALAFADAAGNAAVQLQAAQFGITLALVDTGRITAAPENPPHNNDVAAAGGIDELGTLPFGRGRAGHPGTAYTNALMVIGTVRPPANGGAPRLQWRRQVSERSWSIDNLGNNLWSVGARSALHTRQPGDDLPSHNFDVAVPSQTGHIYIYDNPAETVQAGDQNAPVGSIIYTEKQFTVWVESMTPQNGWAPASAVLHYTQIITMQRTAQGWAGVTNNVGLGTTNITMTTAKAQALIGGNVPANNVILSNNVNEDAD